MHIPGHIRIGANTVGKIFFALVLAAAGMSLPYAAGAPNPDQPVPTLVFRMATDILPEGGTKLAGGTVIKPSDWPTLILVEMPNPKQGKKSRCTGTLVGPRVIFFSAHCVDGGDGLVRSSLLRIDGRDIDLSCELHPAYLKADHRGLEPRESQDFALCLLDDRGVQPASLLNMLFEVIDASKPLEPGEPVLLTGYGCQTLELSPYGELTAMYDKESILGIGDTKIATATGKWPENPAYVTTLSRRGSSQPSICPGDSGGPLFTGVTSSAPSGARRIRGVNSEYCAARSEDNTMCSPTGKKGRWASVSAVSATAFPSFGTWSKKWVQANGNAIVCGINRQQGEPPCRQ